MVEGFVISVDGRIVHKGVTCPYQMEATDTVMHAWGGRRDAFCMDGDRLLTHPQHADLVGFLQHEALARDDSICWRGRVANGSTAASRFFAVPVAEVDRNLGSVGV